MEIGIELADLERQYYGSSPLLVASVVLILVAAAHFLGAWFQRRKDRRPNASPSKDTEARILVTAVLQLLSLLLGFTLSLAIAGFQNQRTLAVEEANAIYATFLATDPLQEPYRSAVRKQLIQYTELRIAAATSKSFERGVELAARSMTLQDDLYRSILAAYTVQSREALTPALLKCHELIEVGADRMAARAPLVPVRVRTMLLLFILIAAGTLGFSFTGGVRKGTYIVMLLFILVFVLIVDIEHAASGAIMESQSPMKVALGRMTSV